MARYGASKLANMLFFFELDRRLRAAGVVDGGCWWSPWCRRHKRDARFPDGAGHDANRPLAAEHGRQRCLGPLQAATGNVRSGSYYGPTGMSEMRGPSGESHPADHARDPVSAKKLWDLSIEMSGVDPGLAP